MESVARESAAGSHSQGAGERLPGQGVSAGAAEDGLARHRQGGQGDLPPDWTARRHQSEGQYVKRCCEGGNEGESPDFSEE